MRFRTGIVVALGATLLAPVAVAVTSTSASAVSCPQIPSNNPTGPVKTLASTVTGRVNIRSGPSTSCAAVSYAYPGDGLVFICYARTTYQGETWTFLYNTARGGGGSYDAGWIRDDLLQGLGSWTTCA